MYFLPAWDLAQPFTYEIILKGGSSPFQKPNPHVNPLPPPTPTPDNPLPKK